MQENLDAIKKEIVLLGEIKCAACVEYLGSYFKEGHLFVRLFMFHFLVLSFVCAPLA